ncbi:DUF1788 domain-containing protein [Cyanobium sp. Aljojuca 7D2]|uniref:BREX protein BrxB domain-containing protein n=1 Tax=Cyanobium sp. Aljojuca 7D2 TaxID=2823698 RepID=UPI0020CF544F|nr:BREX protein BrxB domain-containing protein [Cyanobium sp. Aljojuca 7D2]MCP9891415.1 DUF1788 domain-containing protein [Cyanobium sp. Aljojuca 7D2]
MSSVSGLDKRLQEVLSRPEFLGMRGVAKEVPIFIQTYSPADEDQLRVVVKGAEQYLRKQGLRVKHVDLFDLLLQLLESEGWLQEVMQHEASWSKSDLFDDLQNVADPSDSLVPKLMEALGDDTQISLITGSGRIYPFLRTHTILEALQPAMVRHPVVVFFPGEYSRDTDGGSYLRLFGTTTASKIENPHYRATNLDYFDIKS